MSEQQSSAVSEQPRQVKTVYIKRWRTLVELPLKYAGEIVEALRTEPQSASVAEANSSFHKVSYNKGIEDCVGVIRVYPDSLAFGLEGRMLALKTAEPHCQAGIEQRHLAQLLTILSVMKSAHSRETDRLMSIWSRDIEAVEAAVTELTRPLRPNEPAISSHQRSQGG
jgi:hypothetical protein